MREWLPSLRTLIAALFVGGFLSSTGLNHSFLQTATATFCLVGALCIAPRWEGFDE